MTTLTWIINKRRLKNKCQNEHCLETVILDADCIIQKQYFFKVILWVHNLRLKKGKENDVHSLCWEQNLQKKFHIIWKKKKTSTMEKLLGIKKTGVQWFFLQIYKTCITWYLLVMLKYSIVSITKRTFHFKSLIVGNWITTTT